MPQSHTILLVLYLLLLAFTCINPPYPNELLLQHIPTTIGLALLVWMDRRAPLSMASFVLVLIFLMLHAVGARFIYSYVPYDALSIDLFGVSITEAMGFRRNHYDRLIHFAYGLLFVHVIRERFMRHGGLRPRLALYVAVEFIMATSLLYELAEWLIAVLLSPEAAEAYNGQQGDLWDAQKDMALAAAGALISAAVLLVRERRAMQSH